MSKPLGVVALLLCSAVAELPAFVLPDLPKAEFLETFQGDSLDSLGWVESKVEKYENQQWKLEAHRSGAFADDKSLLVGKSHASYGISKKLAVPLDLKKQDFVVQYEVRFHEPIGCSGGYLKLLMQSKEFEQESLNDKTPFVIMFGPDGCGANKKVHLIFQHRNPVSGELEEKHNVKQLAVFKADDGKSHLFTLIFRHADQSYAFLFDHKQEFDGFLTYAEHFKPPFNPPEMVDDPADKKPSDWVDEKEIVDPEASKPDDWDETAPRRIADPDATKPAGWLDDVAATIPDPSVEKPEDWDDEDDGEWEAPPVENPECVSSPGCGEWSAPMIENPEFKGKWKAPMIVNPEYKGEWTPRKIKNPNHFHQNRPSDNLDRIAAVAIEIQANEVDIQFDNIIISTDVDSALQFGHDTFDVKSELESEAMRLTEREDKRAQWQKELDEGSFSAIVSYAFGEFLFFAQDHSYKLLAGTGVFLVGMVYYCLFTGTTPTYEHKKDDDAATTDEKEMKSSSKKDAKVTEVVEEEDEASEPKEKTDAPKVRRRTRRAD